MRTAKSILGANAGESNPGTESRMEGRHVYSKNPYAPARITHIHTTTWFEACQMSTRDFYQLLYCNNFNYDIASYAVRCFIVWFDIKSKKLRVNQRSVHQILEFQLDCVSCVRENMKKYFDTFGHINIHVHRFKLLSLTLKYA